MKIVYILHNLGLDGSFLTWADTVRILTKQKGISAHVICEKVLTQSTDYQQLEKECNLTTHTMPIVWSVKSLPPKNVVMKLRWIRKLLTALWGKSKFFIRLYRCIKSINPDIVHTNVGVVHEGFFVAKTLNIPHIWHLREYQDVGCNWWIYPTKRIYETYLRRSHVIAITHDLAKHYNQNIHKTIVIPDGVGSNQNVPQIQSKQHYFLCASRLHPQKHIEDAVLAFALFQKENPDYELIIAGDGDKNYLKSIITIAADNNLIEKIKFLGYCPKEKVYALMQNAKALLVPSEYEGFGLMTAEAIFNGTIVIGRNNGGTAEIITTVGGFLYDDNYQALAEQMNIVANLNESTYRDMVIESQRIAVANYSIEKNVDSIYEVYKSVL